MIQLLLFDEHGYCDDGRLEELERLLNDTAADVGLLDAWPEDGWLSVALLDREPMAVANETFLEHEGPTDVLTFDYRGEAETAPDDGEVQVVAELLLCPEVAAEAADNYQQSLGEEVFLYLVHGLLHLAGYDDKRPVQKQEMETLQRTCLAEASKQAELSSLFSLQ